MSDFGSSWGLLVSSVLASQMLVLLLFPRAKDLPLGLFW